MIGKSKEVIKLGATFSQGLKSFSRLQQSQEAKKQATDYISSKRNVFQDNALSTPPEVLILFRDGGQSGFASTTEQLGVEYAPYLNAMKPSDGRSFRVEVHSGMSADANARTIGRNFFSELEKFCSALSPDIKKQILYRSLVGGGGYQPVPRDVTQESVRIHKECGVTDIRVFDALNSLDNLSPAIEASLNNGLTTRAAYCFTKTDPLLQAQRFKDFLKQLTLRFGDDVAVDFKDMSAGMRVADVESLMQVFRDFLQENTQLKKMQEIGKHSHSEQGYTDGANIAFLRIGGRRIDLVPDCMGTHGGILYTAKLLKGTPYDLGMDVSAIEASEEFLKERLPLFERFQIKYPPNIKVLARYSQAPGGSFGSTYARLKALNMTDKMENVLEEMGNVRKKLNEVALVTPVALFVTQQALQYVLTKSRRPIKDIQNLVAGNFGPLDGVDPKYQKEAMVARIEDFYKSLKKENPLSAQDLAKIASEVYDFAEKEVSLSIKIKSESGDLSRFKGILKGESTQEDIEKLLQECPTLNETIAKGSLTLEDTKKVFASGTRNMVIPPVDLLEPGLEKAEKGLKEFCEKNNLQVNNFEHDRILWATLQTGNPIDQPLQEFLKKRQKNDPLLFPGSVESLEKAAKEKSATKEGTKKAESVSAVEPFQHMTSEIFESPVKADINTVLSEFFKKAPASAEQAEAAKDLRVIIRENVLSKYPSSSNLEILEATYDTLTSLKETNQIISPAILEPTEEEKNAKELRIKTDFIIEAVGIDLIQKLSHCDYRRYQLSKSSLSENNIKELVQNTEDYSFFSAVADSKLQSALDANSYASQKERQAIGNSDEIKELSFQIRRGLFFDLHDRDKAENNTRSVA